MNLITSTNAIATWPAMDRNAFTDMHAWSGKTRHSCSDRPAHGEQQHPDISGRIQKSQLWNIHAWLQHPGPEHPDAVLSTGPIILQLLFPEH
ncbi:hypothetical protein M419DRAFT_124491 [Trichoderma reesei RUT C-30]|uniref:Uncharacterized protein n=1 Tax=Hypocrea jecorina (strain ATCC 56765 / BCRC 32924 / NRRL 11460 / Rut C-30) TaxID=1344414 RepID=A0A024S4C5_HYPJR|nr:hypothetical protein M419DRAFT_124491 [Trichoderma reesei RUT C-30]